MSVFDAMAGAVGEGAAYLIGKIVGRRKSITAEKAQRIGQNILIGAMVVFFLALAVLGVGT